MTEYQEVIACTNKPLFSQKIFLKRSLDPITICLIEECFKVKIVKTKVQEKNWLKASNVKFRPVKIICMSSLISGNSAAKGFIVKLY